MPPSLSSRRVLSWGLVALLTLCFAQVSAQAQSNGDGSPYSRFGLGMLTDFSSPQGQAMGGGAYALRSLNYNPTANPALWSDQVFTRLSAGASFQRVAATGEGGQASRLSSGLIEGLQLSFPLYERTLGVGLSFQPYTQHNYRVQRRDTLRSVNVPEAPFRRNFRGKGGLHRFRAGLGYRINELVSVGASVDVLFGIIEKERRTEFGNSAFRNTDISDATRLSGVSGTVGGQLTFADALREDDALSIGASVALPTTLSGTRVLTLGEGRNLEQDTLQSVDGEVSLPLRSRLGVAYQPNSTWTFTLDGLYEPWSTSSSTFSSQGQFSRRFPDGGDETLSDRWRISAGLQVIPGADDPLSGFFGNTGYRLGVATEHLYVRPRNSQSVQSYTLTGGFSFPTSLSGTRIDLNLRAGTRGTTESALVRDNFYGVSLHVNFGERWFQERKLR